jgi:hypothetical protein
VTSRRDFFRSMIARSGFGRAGEEGSGSPVARERPIEPAEGTPERLERAFGAAPDQRDIAEWLARRGYLELLPDGRFCTAPDFMARSVRSPLPAPLAAWLARAQGRSAPDPGRPADSLLLHQVREEMASGQDG